MCYAKCNFCFRANWAFAWISRQSGHWAVRLPIFPSLHQGNVTVDSQPRQVPWCWFVPFSDEWTGCCACCASRTVKWFIHGPMRTLHSYCANSALGLHPGPSNSYPLPITISTATATRINPLFCPSPLRVSNPITSSRDTHCHGPYVWSIFCGLSELRP